MHRVELKEGGEGEGVFQEGGTFLMHRVELKDNCSKLWTIYGFGS